MRLNDREFLIWKEREGGERERDGRPAGQQSGIFNVKLGLGEIERQRDRKIERQ
jgi:hypothetical protein